MIHPSPLVRTALARALLTLALVVAALLVACTTRGQLEGGRFRDEAVDYEVGAPGPGWKEIAVRKANAAWYNDELGASLLVNSHCEGIGDAPLEGLTNDLMMGMTERQILSQQKRPWSRREALESVASAKLDGVPRKLAIFVLKKDWCVYDIVLDAPPERFDAALAGYDRVRDGFDVDARPGRG